MFELYSHIEVYHHGKKIFEVFLAPGTSLYERRNMFDDYVLKFKKEYVRKEDLEEGKLP